MTIGDWLAARSPRPPDALAARLRELLAPALERDSEQAADALLDAADAMLRDLVDAGCATRARALDLLAADALVTYSFEAASERPEMLESRARSAARRLASIAEPHRA